MLFDLLGKSLILHRIFAFKDVNVDRLFLGTLLAFSFWVYNHGFILLLGRYVLNCFPNHIIKV